MTEPVRKQRKQREHNPQPSVSGVMECDQRHYWGVRDLNPERKAIACPVCGGYTSIAKGLTRNDGPKR